MKNALGHDKEAIAACGIVVDDVHAALQLIYGKTASDKALGEKNIKIALGNLVELMLKPGSISVGVRPKLDLWDFEVTYVFVAHSPGGAGSMSFARSTRCVDPVKNMRLSAMDLCVDTVGCCVWARRKYEEEFIKSCTADDIFYAMHFATEVLAGPYL